MSLNGKRVGTSPKSPDCSGSRIENLIVNKTQDEEDCNC
jgi:hypothetical protein